jgi:hypothetical protein
MRFRTFGAALALAVLALPAQAEFHLFRIVQVYSNADGTQQYVMLREMTGANNEHFWAGHTLTTNGAGGFKQFTFPANLPSSQTANRSVLIATAGLAARGIAADYTIPNGFVPTGGGSVNYAPEAGVDMINIPALPTDGATAVDRNGNPTPATPTNFAGATITLSPTPPPTTPDLNQHGLTGSWFEPATNGQGVELEVYPNLAAPGTSTIQGAWFTYDVPPTGGADHDRWYTFSGNGQSGMTSVPITIYRNVGGNFNALPITAAAVVGSGTLSFTDCSNGTLAYAFSDGSGRTGSIALTRLTPNVTCTVGTTPGINTDFDYSGNWFDATTSGQGFVFDVNPLAPVFFLTWYTYAPAGQAAGAAGQRWFTGQSSTFGAGARTVALTLFETTGGAFDQASTPPPATVAVGTATVTLASCGSAQMQFNFTGGSSAGKAGTIALSRVGPTPPGCTSAAQADPAPPMPPPPCYGPYCYMGSQ